ncbi:4-hydroxybenzoyl-CoA thioesterase [Planctopirus ephydatiae]|uniref:4-hydroxybenzoyl-CoA thioesterase n=1 Tax=Planctopirus ephydatiae TaxID=2528019 RepID=A0A518GHW4_9PLAN|nr:thioesterase family protein [Planctopirus ephydatiae]QDV28182.1 4-hydroxybenzoyl-CoA thioesterase [Planctopirus ephydatiae]
MPHFSTQRRVEFYETDMAGIVHFSNFFRYMEQAEHEFFRSLGLKISGKTAEGIEIGWPRVACQCDYRAPARYEEVITIDVTIIRQTTRSLTMSYVFSRDGKILASGEMTTVCCTMQEGALKAIEIPPSYLDRLPAVDFTGTSNNAP